jgi:hypothetical protein
MQCYYSSSYYVFELASYLVWRWVKILSLSSLRVVRGDGKGTQVFSDETVVYGYEFSVTLTTDRLHYKLYTHPLVRAGAPRRRAK